MTRCSGRRPGPVLDLRHVVEVLDHVLVVSLEHLPAVALQDLAADYRADPCREPRRAPPTPLSVASPESERALLDRLGLLPG